MADFRLILVRTGYIAAALVAVVCVLAVLGFLALLMLATYRVMRRHAMEQAQVVRLAE